MFLILIYLVSFSTCKIILYTENIYISNIRLFNGLIYNFSINLELKGKEIPKNITINNIFKIYPESSNLKEEYKFYFSCNFKGINEKKNSYIECILKGNISSKIKEPFYFQEEHFKKSFTYYSKNESLNFTIELLNETFLFAMIDNFRAKGNLFKNKFSFKISNIVIPIAMSLDDWYTYPTIVSITSIIENSYRRTKFDFYIMHPLEFKEENKKKLKSLEKKYKKCSINLINMRNKFKTAKLTGYITTPAYYRLALSSLLPNIEKIIYLDGDIISFIDLKEMYDFDMEGFYYKGFLDTLQDSFNPDNEIYICSGVLLINLEEIRKDDIENTIYKFMKDNKERLLQEPYHDQPIINAVCYRKIGILPPEFGVFNFQNLSLLYYATSNYRYKFKYTKEQLKHAYYNPKILHYNKIKPWKRTINNTHLKIWWDYAKKSGFYDEMNQKYTAYYMEINKKNDQKIENINFIERFVNSSKNFFFKIFNF